MASMDIKHISQQIKNLEEELLTRNVRKNSERLEQLLDDGFIEFGSSGNRWTKQSVIETLKNESCVETEITDFIVTLLSDKIALATYTAHSGQSDKKGHSSLRSSIWKLTNDDWKIVFHQGTYMPE